MASEKKESVKESKVSKYVSVMLDDISDEWKEYLTPGLDELVEQLIVEKNITPSLSMIFQFARLTPIDKIKVVIVGQDPYPKAGDAHGLAFSCMNGVPASLKNIYKCLFKHKCINAIPDTGNLEYWAGQGVLLLNRSLTTTIGKPNAHTGIWEEYTTELVRKISALRPLIFMLWGNNARSLIDDINSKSVVYEWSHPSPLAQSKQAFIECNHFTEANKLLKKLGRTPIDWNIGPPQSAIETAFSLGPMTQVVFTDGSCWPNTCKPDSVGGYAASFVLGTMKDIVLYGNIKNKPHYASNQRAEGTAILKVLEYLKDNIGSWDEVIIVSDSKFWIDMFESYMPKWVDQDLFEQKKNPDMTRPMWNLYTELTEDYGKNINFRHIHSHNKDGWQSYADDTYENFCYMSNDYVDKLALFARLNLKPGEDITETAEYDEK